MRGVCEIAICSSPTETRKIDEDFEAIKHNVCWECGDKIKENLQPNQLETFLEVIEAIEKELK